MKIIALDSGLDKTGAAVFSVNRYRECRDVIPHVRALRSVVETRELTAPVAAGDIGLRLFLQHEQVRDLVARHAPIAVYIEVPRYAGRSAGVGNERQADVAKLYMAIGALMTGVRAGFAILQMVPALHDVRASGAAKPLRHQLLHAWSKEIGSELPRGPKGGEQQDVWDAMWIGVDVLVNRIERDITALNPSEKTA